MIAVATMDQNAEILREIGAAWRGGDELCCSLSTSLDFIVDTIIRWNDALHRITLYREIIQ